MARTILFFFTLFSSAAFAQEITKEHWTSCLQVVKEERKFSGSVIVSLGGRHEFTMVVRFKGEEDGWHRFAHGTSGGPRDGEQSVMLAKLEKDGLWVKKEDDEKAQLAFPFPLKVGQEWAQGASGTISLVGIRDFEAFDRTYEDCLVFETKGEEDGRKTTGELWYAPQIGLLFSKKKGATFQTSLRRMPAH